MLFDSIVIYIVYIYYCYYYYYYRYCIMKYYPEQITSILTDDLVVYSINV